jgi:hypothetical protein
MTTELKQGAASGRGPLVAIRGFAASHDGTPSGINVPEFSESEDCEALERKIAALNRQINILEDEQQQALNQIAMLFAKLKAEVRQERLKLQARWERYCRS